MTSMSATGLPPEATLKPGRINQYVGALVASLAGFSLGVSLAWNSSAGDVLRNVLKASANEIGLVGGVLNAGACCGLLLVPLILRFVSRTGAMFISIPVNIVGWAFICFADQQVWLLIVGRVLCGLVGGIFCVLTPLYIAEIADKNMRYRLLTFFHLFINCGIMYAYLIAYVLDERDAVWRYSLTCAVSCAPIALVIFLPESPLYHVIRGNTIAARRSMRWYRGKQYNCQEEIDQLEQLANFKKTGFKRSMKTMKKSKVIWSLIVCHGVIIAQQLSGINTMIFYALVIFNNGGSGNMTGEEMTLVVGAVQIFACLLCTLTIDRIGRRILLTVSAASTGLFLVLLVFDTDRAGFQQGDDFPHRLKVPDPTCFPYRSSSSPARGRFSTSPQSLGWDSIGWYFDVRDDDPEFYDETYGWMPPTWISLFFAAFNIGLGPISWSMLADAYPIEIRVTASTSAAFLSWLISLIATLTFGEMATALGIPRTMWLFGGFSWLAAIFTAVLVRDNGGKSLLDVQIDFGTHREETRPESSQVVEET